MLNPNEEWYEVVIFSQSKNKSIRLHGRISYNNFKKYCDKYNVKVVSDDQLLPFSQVTYKDVFRTVSENASATMSNMITGKIPYNEDQLKLIESYKKRADKFMNLSLPIAWLKKAEFEEVSNFLKEIYPNEK